MSCTTCKKTNREKINDALETKKINPSIWQKIKQYSIRILVFLFLCVIAVPLVIPATIWALWVSTVSNKGINVVPILVALGKRIFKDEDDEDEDDEDEDKEQFESDEDYDNLMDGDYELVNPYEITTLN